MIPILDCGYGKFKCLLKLIKKNNDDDEHSQYKGNYRRKVKREEKEREEREREEIRESFIKPD